MGLNCTARVGMGQAQPGEGHIGQCWAAAAGLLNPLLSAKTGAFD